MISGGIEVNQFAPIRLTLYVLIPDEEKKVT